MAIFGRKKEEDYEEEEDIQQLEIKDLKPENRKRRKEVAKPWGKRERFTVLIFLLATAIVSAVLALSSRNWKLPGLPQIRLSLPKVNLDFFSGETITVGPGKRAVDPKLVEKGERIKEGFDKKTENLSGTYAFKAIDLTSGYSFGKNDDEILTAASLMKLPAIVTIYLESENGGLDLDNKPQGSNLTYRELAREMGKNSNNQAQKIVVKALGREKIQSVIDSIGMKNTSYKENETTASDIGLFFQRLWRREIVSEKSRDEILGYLTNTIYEDWLKAGIPEVRVAHKYGREVHVVNDAGIVFAEKPFVLVVMSRGIIDTEADAFIPEFAALVFKELK